MRCTNFAPRRWAAAVLAVGALGGSAAADSAPDVASLLAQPAQLAQWLRDRDPMVGAAGARHTAAVAATRQARVYPNPQLSVGLGGLPIGRGNVVDGVEGPTSPADVANVNVTASELIEIGKRGPRASAADARARAAGEQVLATLGDRLGAATDSLGHLAYVAARRDTVAANLDAAKRLRDLEKVRLDNKDLSEAEFLRIQLDTEDLELQLGRAEAELAGAVAGCTALLQAPCSPTGLSGAALDHAAPLPPVLPATDGAIAGRPARQASRLEAEGLRWDAKLAEKRSIPDLTVGLGYTYDRYEYSGAIPHTLTLQFGIPLAVFDRGKHDAATARAAAAATEAEDRAAVIEAHGTVAALTAQRASLESVLAQLEASAVPKSTQIIAQTRKAFDLGQARLADLLLVERSHRDLLLRVLDTRFELFTVRAQLRQELGLDDEIGRDVTKGSR